MLHETGHLKPVSMVYGPSYFFISVEIPQCIQEEIASLHQAALLGHMRHCTEHQMAALQ